MTPRTIRHVLPWFVSALAVCAHDAANVLVSQDPTTLEAEEPEEVSMQVQYLEIVTPDVEATCASLAKLHGVTFSEPVPEFGNARTAALASGGQLGVRAPMHAAETPVVRPYILVEDVEAATEAAKAAGGEIAMPPTEIPGRGTFAIYFLGGNQYGIWQL